MANVVKIITGVNGRQFLIDTTKFPDIKKGDIIIIEGDNCQEYAKVLSSITNKELKSEERTILRIATNSDLEKIKKLNNYIKQDKEKVQQKVKQYNLSMKLISVNRSFDETKLLIVYTAEDRVDFRLLVKDLASVFHLRVEMRQIGDREATSIIGGYGCCGQELCCKTLLTENNSTTIKMAKLQGIALNPTKINGVCGKLMCCLQYEYNDYYNTQQKIPPLGSDITTQDGTGKVVFHDLFNEQFAVKYVNGDDEKIIKYNIDDIKE